MSAEGDAPRYSGCGACACSASPSPLLAPALRVVCASPAARDVVAAGEDTALAPLTQDIKQVLMTSATHPDAPRQLADIGKR